METPPLTRRKQHHRKEVHSFSGNTSAYAEKTFGSNERKPLIWKHLRLRGENRYTLHVQPISPETPPLTRRKPFCCLISCFSLRNTSAYAEKTWNVTSSNQGKQKHLRLRGENLRAAISARYSVETPPLTRRKLRTNFTCSGNSRNTSAYAEKTANFQLYNFTFRKHLRLRGENAALREIR